MASHRDMQVLSLSSVSAVCALCVLALAHLQRPSVSLCFLFSIRLLQPAVHNGGKPTITERSVLQQCSTAASRGLDWCISCDISCYLYERVIMAILVMFC
ncbi:hypothetical protein V8C35DRAFT_304704 [Trichoderma chlorosporum]